MKMSEKYNWIKRYPILIGFVIIAIFMGVLLFHKYSSERPEGEWTVVPKELAREGTVDQFQNPEDLVKYLIASLEKKDLDLFLRACAIDETLNNNPFYFILDGVDKFGYDMALPPSANYEEYRPLSSLLLGQYYTKQYDEYQELFQDSSNIKVEKIGILYPEKQLNPDVEFQTTKSCKRWGADREVQIGALLQVGQKFYMTSFTVADYYGYWKIFDFGTALTNEERGSFIKETTRKEFDDMIGQGNQLSIIERLNDTNGNKEKIAAEVVRHPEKEILPPNYFIVGSSYGQNQRDTIQKFIISLQKKDPVKALTYFDKGNLDEDLNVISSERIDKQAEYAKQVSHFYYGILGIPFFKGEKTLVTLEETTGSILEKLNPYPIRYLYIKGILKVSDINGNSEEQYVTFYKFNGKYYMSGYTLREEKEGWQITSLSASEYGLEAGEVKETTKEKYDEVIGDEYKRYPY